MKKTYFAPEAQKIRFLTQELMGPSQLVQPGNNSVKPGTGNEDVTELLPFKIF